ncbi:UPF0729 protein AAEL015238 like protein [Argiope bruennichi]|uniref:UPF0729 protein AAEL015238 like protein n=1 Tax=Argiope bruennichi TaxID=94029 RepID=A0A8T0E4A0_ARGBR|nr:UPF0729 protein AAEL015238 like protein [Argiope bruennichi]
MVCIPCIIAPVLLFIWYKFIQPVVLKIWNPWAPKQSIKSSAEKNGHTDKTTACPFSSKKEVVEDSCEKVPVDKKID